MASEDPTAELLSKIKLPYNDLPVGVSPAHLHSQQARIAALEAEVAELLKVCDTARALAVPSLLAELEERGMPYTRKRVARLIDALSRYDARKAAGAEGT